MSAHVSSGNTADWIRMPFGVVNGVGLGMGVLHFGGDRRLWELRWARPVNVREKMTVRRS